MRIDVGCGLQKHPLCFGIDKHPYPGVDLVHDMNQPLPLVDNSVEFVMASRSLPYVDDLVQTMKELYRVCVDRAVICVLAPYAHSFHHASNPFLKQKFDEHTPRYLTSHFFQPPTSAVCPEVASYLPASVPFDFRLLRMELFYRPPFIPPFYDPEELDLLKSLQPNVIDEIMYHLVTVKKDICNDELLWLARQEHPEPLHAGSLRNRGDAPAPDSTLEPASPEIPSEQGEAAYDSYAGGKEAAASPRTAGKKLKRQMLRKTAKSSARTPSSR